MGGPLNTSILRTYRLGGLSLIWLTEPPQGGQPSSLRGWNKMFWIRYPTSRCLAATLGKNTEQSHALVTNRPESRLHFQASPFGRFSAAGPTEAVDRLPASLLQPQALAMERGSPRDLRHRRPLGLRAARVPPCAFRARLFRPCPVPNWYGSRDGHLAHTLCQIF